MPEPVDTLRAAGATPLAPTPTLDSIRERVARRRRRRRASLATVTAVAGLTGLLAGVGAARDDRGRDEVVVGTEGRALTCEDVEQRPPPAPTVSTIGSRTRIWDTTITLDPPAPGFEPRLSARDAVGRAAPPIAHATSIEALLADYVSPRSSATDGSAEAWAPAWVVIGRGVPVTPAIGTSCVLGTDIVAVDPTTGAQIGRTQIGRDIEMVRVLHADDRVVEVELAVPDEVPAGERLWADVVVRNIGRRTVFWQAGGGTPPAQAYLGAPRAGESPAQAWSGDPAELAAAVLRTAGEREFVDAAHTGLRRVGRTLEGRVERLEPGEERRIRVSVDVRPGPADATTLPVRAVARFYEERPPQDRDGSPVPRPDVVAAGEIRVRGTPAGAEEALAAFAADPRLARFVEATATTGITNRWYAELAWWRGAWELEVTPHFGDAPRGQSRYRTRFAVGRVVDARRIWWDQAPADDPEGTRFPGAPADDVDPAP